MKKPYMDKYCLECVHLRYYPAEEGYSEYTPGSDASMQCLKGFWNLDLFRDYKPDLKSKLQTAKNCFEFELECA